MVKRSKPAKPKKELPSLFEGTREGRFLCEVLDAMRKTYETRDFSGLMAMIEQIQEYANRMESGLSKTRYSAFDAYDALNRNKDTDPKKAIRLAMEALQGRWPALKDRS